MADWAMAFSDYSFADQEEELEWLATWNKTESPMNIPGNGSRFSNRLLCTCELREGASTKRSAGNNSKVEKMCKNSDPVSSCFENHFAGMEISIWEPFVIVSVKVHYVKRTS